ncbi:MAG: beta-lactamase family protein [Sandaracinaceae bacterium]|nr:beta-lactamase family protein [Sandaracinaceae bacterium]
MTRLDVPFALLEQAVERGMPPSAQACVIHDGEVVHSSAHGEATPQSLFDLASVTKAAATAMAIALLCAREGLSLDSTVASHIPAFGAAGKETLTVRELLGHRSGLPAWRPFFARVMREVPELYPPHSLRSPSLMARARAMLVSDVMQSPLEVRGRRVYSDLGFIVLGELVRAITGLGLDVYCASQVFGPLSRDLLFLHPSSPAARHVLPTGRTRPRAPAPGQERDYVVPAQTARLDPGDVDDDNAWAMGGVAGHAGLFGTAISLAKLGWRLVEELDDGRHWSAQPIVREMVALDPCVEGPARALGFDVPALEGSAAGSLLGRAGPRGAIGHLGFTGCSLWVDLDRRLVIALCTNRTLPGRDQVERFRPLRPAFHDAVVRSLD